ncbi:MAG: hypothetical protein ACLF0G_05615 [Candidatus Brocadiia bacterium]
MPDEYISFDDALRELQMQEAELRALVSQGKLRAFRDENTLKFRRSDVEGLRKERETEPTLVMKPEEEGGEEEEPKPVAEEPIDLLADEQLDYDDTAETIIGDTGEGETGDVDLDMEEEEPAPAPDEQPGTGEEPGTKVPTIELTPPPGAEEPSPDETAVPTLEIGEEGEESTAETEVPTMVLGLDDYEDTQMATEDVATEEVYIDEGELAEEPATADIEEPAVSAEDEREAERAIGSITASSSYGTGEPLAIREQPSPMFTAFSAITALILLIPGGMFFFFLATGQVPKWDFLKSVFQFFWDLLEVGAPKSY